MGRTVRHSQDKELTGAEGSLDLVDNDCGNEARRAGQHTVCGDSSAVLKKAQL